jgi:hypothetical protein
MTFKDETLDFIIDSSLLQTIPADINTRVETSVHTMHSITYWMLICFCNSSTCARIMSSMTAKLQLYIITGKSNSPAEVPLGVDSVTMSGNSLGHDWWRGKYSQVSYCKRV